jgi:hypothetical protein
MIEQSAEILIRALHERGEDVFRADRRASSDVLAYLSYIYERKRRGIASPQGAANSNNLP